MPTKKNPKNIIFPSELRFDLVSKDWVVVATGRAKRPETFKKEKRQKASLSIKKCPFCNIKTQANPVSVWVNGKKIVGEDVPKDWTAVVIPNKYPVFLPYKNLDKKTEGNLYQRMNAVGSHEVIITRSHTESLGQLEIKKIKEVIDIYQDRCLDLMKKDFINHISIFYNHGIEAGASISHPHSQIIATYLIDVDLNKALETSKNYYQKTKKCIYCEMSKWERKARKRIIFENKEFLAICPFASKSSFEVIISPKKHLSFFEKITEKEKWQLAEAFQAALSKLYKGINDPAYNFYLHTAPCDGKDYPFYHWHWTILPKTSIWAGFELGTKIEISTIEPEKAAEYLRKQ